MAKRKRKKILTTMTKENKPKLYHNFWTNFNVELYKRVLKAKEKQNEKK